MGDPVPTDHSWRVRTQQHVSCTRPAPRHGQGSVATSGRRFAGRLTLDAVDSLRLEIAPAQSGAGDTFELKVFINGNDVLGEAALGLDPFDVIVPTNHLIARPQPHTARIGRCTCGDYECRPIDVTITRDGPQVHWDWLKNKPMDQRVTFAWSQYAGEISRVASDVAWETPERTAGRLVLAGADRAGLRRQGIELQAAHNDWRDPGVFLVLLVIDSAFEAEVELPWAGRTPEQLAWEMCALLSLRPQDWTVHWFARHRSSIVNPRMAGPGWKHRSP